MFSTAPPPPDPDWIEKFMGAIQERDYDGAREVLRKAIAHGIGNRVAEQYAGVLEDFLRKRDEFDNPNPSSVTKYGICVVKPNKDGRGNGLFVPGYCTYGAELWNERPLSFVQSPSSRKVVQVCCACMAPLGTLASQLSYLGFDAPAGAETVHLSPSCGEAVACPAGCDQVFCSRACCDWALKDTPHVILCKGTLPAKNRQALETLEKIATEADQENILLLVNNIAAMLLALRRGESLEQVLHRFAHQFATRLWDSPWEGWEQNAGKGDTPEKRKEIMDQVVGPIRELFAGDELAEPLLDQELWRAMLGTFETVCMCINLSHPLNHKDNIEEIARLLDEKLLAQIATLQEGVDSDSEDEECDEEAQDAGEVGEDDADARSPLESLRSGTLFANVLGTALIEALSFTNHSCLPNCEINFATPGSAYAGGPGLWIYSLSRRPLVPGDEVTMSYEPSVVGKPVEYRQKKMMQVFGFSCKCRPCVTDIMLAAEDDTMPADFSFKNHRVVAPS